jgi:UDP-N-acetylenolpyruvoylglucosamine reductase
MNMTEAAQFSFKNLRGVLRHNVDMRRHTSWRAGGRADTVYQPADISDLAHFLRELPAAEPLMAVGLGSNLLVRDGGIRGTVLLLHSALNALRMEPDGTIYAEAGIAGAKLARFAAQNDLQGEEFFAGIPGTVGGMLAMNAGCYGAETWEKVARVQVVTRHGEILQRTAGDYEIGYRHVALKNPQEEWFAAAWFKFEQGDGNAARSAIKALLDRRGNAQPLNLPNAGSVFRNPPGDYAARLIESCGLKGKRIGGAEVSAKHANFIVNTGGATAQDIETLIGEIRAAVEKQTGIRLQPEVRIVGEAA